MCVGVWRGGQVAGQPWGAAALHVAGGNYPPLPAPRPACPLTDKPAGCVDVRSIDPLNCSVLMNFNLTGALPLDDNVWSALNTLQNMNLYGNKLT